MDEARYDEIQDYCESVSSKESKLLNELNRTTYLKFIHPRMLSGSFQGRFLSMISKMISPKRILEIGTYTGYSALCLAEGLQKGGTLLTIEKQEELIPVIEEYISKSGNGDVIQARIGDAMEILPSLSPGYDLIFLDADKERYPDYLPLIINLIRPGGIILIDNMLWEGKVLDKTLTDEQTVNIRRTTEAMRNDDRLEQVLIPLRDGLMMVRRITEN